MLHCSKLSDKVCSSCLSPQQSILLPVLPSTSAALPVLHIHLGH